MKVFLRHTKTGWFYQGPSQWSPEQGTAIRLETGMRLILPTDRSNWPSQDQVRYHQRQIFKGPESLVS